MITNSPAMSTSSSSVRVSTANAASAPPRPSDPVSPMKIFAGLFVIITVSVILQVGYFKLSGGKRIFKMAPLQHHFELKGWNEVTIVVRFWIIAGLFVAAALGVFYGDWLLSHGGMIQ